MNVDGVLHLLSATAGAHLLALADAFDVIWASGWEEKANDHLPHALALPAALPFLTFDAPPRSGHWKIGAIEAYAGDRPLAWIDDAHDAACHDWAARRSAPTLLVATEPHTGLTDEHAARLAAWARRLAPTHP